MTLVYQTLDGTTISKVDIAIARIRQYEPSEGFYVAFSGGKDSIVIYHLVKSAGVKHDVHFSMTTVDPPEVYQFIRENYPEVQWNKPKKSMFQLIAGRKIPPTRYARYCCSELKELHGIGRVIVLGIRREESSNRKDRQVLEKSERNHNTTFLSPIVDWTTAEVWEYIRTNGLRYPSLYDDGYTRLGCIMCPLQGTAGMLKDAERFPKHYKAYLRAFKKMLANHDENSKTSLKGKTPEQVMYWWIYGSHDDGTIQTELSP